MTFDNEFLLAKIKEFEVNIDDFELTGVVKDNMLHKPECLSGDVSGLPSHSAGFEKVCNLCIPGLTDPVWSSWKSFTRGATLHVLVEIEFQLLLAGSVESPDQVGQAQRALRAFDHPQTSSGNAPGFELLHQHVQQLHDAVEHNLQIWATRYRADLETELTGEISGGPQYFVEMIDASDATLELLLRAYMLPSGRPVGFRTALVPESLLRYLVKQRVVAAKVLQLPTDTPELLSDLSELLNEHALPEALELARAL